MKKCPNCSVTSADDAVSCANCGQSLAAVRQAEPAPGKALRRRPDGTTLMGLGGLGIGISVLLLLFFTMSRGSESYGAYYSGGGSPVLALLAQGLFSLGVLMLLTGAIIRAIWFLPGPDSKPAP